MLVLTWTLLAILGGGVVIIVAALLTKVILVFELEVRDRFDFTIATRFFGRWSPLIVIKKGYPAKSEKESSNKKRKSKRRKGQSKIRVGKSRLISALPDLIAGLLRSVHFERLTVDAEVGFKDPADTGTFFGLMAPIMYSQQSPRISIEIGPEFYTQKFSGSFKGVLSVVPIRLILIGARFIWQIFGRSK